MRIVIGDVHGCYKSLLALIEKLLLKYKVSDMKELPITFVGDIIDRGPSSDKVIKLIRENGWDIVTGNHEAMALYFDGKPFGGTVYGDPLNTWGKHGGDDTIMSYNGEMEQWLDDLNWMNSLPLYLEYPNIFDKNGRFLVVTHASCGDYFEQYKTAAELVELDNIPPFDRAEIESVAFQSEALIIENRNFPKQKDNNFFNVFGHSITADKVFNALGEFRSDLRLTDDSIVLDTVIGYAAIDTGCFVTDEPHVKDNGFLTALSFPSLEVTQQENIDE